MRVVPLLLGSIVLTACTAKPESTETAPSPPALVSTVPSTATIPSSATAAAPVASSAPAVVPDKIAVQHLLITYKGAKDVPKGTKPRTKAEAKARAEEARAKALSGADFSAVVAEYTEDPGSKDRQGSLGTITREKVVKPFADAAFALQVDAVSAVVESAYGFHVIKRNQ